MWHMLDDQCTCRLERVTLSFFVLPWGIGSNDKPFHPARDLVQRDILGNVEGVP